MKIFSLLLGLSVMISSGAFAGEHNNVIDGALVKTQKTNVCDYGMQLFKIENETFPLVNVYSKPASLSVWTPIAFSISKHPDEKAYWIIVNPKSGKPKTDETCDKLEIKAVYN